MEPAYWRPAKCAGLPVMASNGVTSTGWRFPVGQSLWSCTSCWGERAMPMPARSGFGIWHEVAVQDLVTSRFEDAEQGFRAILDKAPHDRPARYLLEHTMLMRTELVGMLPSRDWQGVHVHRSKM